METNVADKANPASPVTAERTNAALRPRRNFLARTVASSAKWSDVANCADRSGGIDIAEVCTEEGKLHLYVGIDRTSKFAFTQLHDKADRPTAVAFLEALIEAVPCDLQTILTDNGIQFADCRRTATVGPRAYAPTASIKSVANTASNTGSPSPTIRGLTAKSYG